MKSTVNRFCLAGLGFIFSAGVCLSASAQTELRANQLIEVIARGMEPEQVQALSGAYSINGDGLLMGLPYLEGIEIKAAGLTADQLAQQIRTAYIEAEVYSRCQFTVHQGEQPERQVTVGGEVRNPGAVVYRAGMTVQSLIASAGGATDFAASKVVITRDGKDYEIDLSRSTDANFLVQPDDYVSVWEGGMFRAKPSR